MHLDVPTLMVAGAFLSLLSGLLLIGAWYQFKEMSPVLWWASADLVMAVGIILLAVGGSRSSHTVLGFAFLALTISSILILVSVWLFCGGTLNHPILLLPPVLLLLSTALPRTAVVQDPFGATCNAIEAACLLAGAYLMAFRNPQQIRSRWSLAIILVVHACAIGLQLVANLDIVGQALYMPAVSTLFGVIHFEAMIFLIGSTIFVVMAMREADEIGLRSAADTDALTGLPNRRSFMDKAQRILDRCRHDATPVAVIIFDLDHFKSINDTFGHALGDRTLQLFAEVCRKAMRPNDAVARIGGEEFAAVLTGSGIEAGVAMAERIRKAFGQAAFAIEDREVNSTLSAGVTTCESGCDLQDLLKQADAALYRAKMAGRNRVERHGAATPAVRPHIVRVA